MKMLDGFLFPDGEFNRDLGRTYYALRWWVAVLGLLLPPTLVLVGRLQGVAWGEMGSLSAFHWLDSVTRDVFVGVLCAVGLAIIIYHGYGKTEDRLLNCAGVAAIVVALKPMPWPVEPHAGFRLTWHHAAAVIFFVLIATTIFVCARKTLIAPRKRGAMSEEETSRWDRTYRLWVWIYNGFAIAMVLIPVLAFVLSDRGHATIWVEATGVWVFAWYWVVKTIELLHVSRVESRTGQTAPLHWERGNLVRDD